MNIEFWGTEVTSAIIVCSPFLEQSVFACC
jgi:hypothetical protein